MKRRVISFLLALAMVLAICPTSIFAAEVLPATVKEKQEVAAAAEETAARSEFSAEPGYVPYTMPTALAMLIGAVIGAGATTAGFIFVGKKKKETAA